MIINIIFNTLFRFYFILYSNLISASSLTPPNDILWNSLDKAVAIDFPNEVLPTPG